MPTIKRTVSLTANEAANPLTGSQYEFLPFDAVIQLAAYADAGVTAEANFFSGTDVLLENAPLDEKPTSDNIKPAEDAQVTDVGAAGERLGLTIRETGGAVGPGKVRVVLVITPL